MSNANYSDQLELYRQSVDICAFLNVTIQIVIINELPDKFAALDAAGVHLSSSSFLERFLGWLIPSIFRQFTVAKCTFEQQLSVFKSETVQSYLVGRITNGFGSILLPMLIMPSIVSLLAILFNVSLLVVTIRKISMSTVCNWLLAFDSFCQIPAMLPFLVNLYAVCFSLDQVDYRVCLTSLMWATGSLYASFLAVFFMSLERLLIITMSMKMSQISAKMVLRLSLIAFFACTSFGLAMVLNIFNIIELSLYSNINLAFDSCIYCNNGFYVYSLNKYGISHTILGLALLNYVLMAGVVFWRRIFLASIRTITNNDPDYSQETSLLLRSVFFISIILMIGWLIGSLYFDQIEGNITMLTGKIGINLYPNSTMDAERFSYNSYNWIMGVTMCLFPMASGINAPVLIINNSIYREAYKKTLKLFLICRKNISTSTTTVNRLFISRNRNNNNHPQ